MVRWPKAEPPPDVDDGDVDAIAAWLEDRLSQLLSMDAHWFGGTELHPELRRAWERVLAEAAEIRRLLARRTTPLPDASAVRVKRALARDPAESRSVDRAWERADELKLFLLEVGDAPFIGALLANEEIRAGRGWRVSWAGYFEKAELSELAAAYREGRPTPEQEARAVERLTFLWQRRAEDGAQYRARIGMQKRYLGQSTGPIAALGALLALSIVFATDVPNWTVVLTASAGALGGFIFNALRFREARTLGTLRSIRGAIFVQLVVGAAAGLFLLLLITSGVLGLPGADARHASPQALAVYGFVAGSSEPFFLGLVSKIAAAGEDRPAGPAQADRPAKPGS